MSAGPAAPRGTQAQIRECPGCGLFQALPPLDPGTTAVCTRCGTTLHRASRYTLASSIPLTLTALMLLLIVCTTTLMSVSTAGITLHAGLLAGPVELVSRGMSALAAVVVFVTLIAPLGKLLCTLYVLIRLHQRTPGRHLARVFLFAEWLRPWSMIEVFVLGVFVAYVKLGDLVRITLDVGVYALLALTIMIAWADSALGREAIWKRLQPDDPGPAHHGSGTGLRLRPGAMGCEACGLVSVPRDDAPSVARRAGPRCPRCDSPLHERKPESIARTWALVIAAAVLYVPANYFPVLTVMQLGAGAPSTILGGVEELLSSHMYPLAALVFFASVLVPMLKLVGLTIMLVATQTGRAEALRRRTRLYHIVRWIGRWSMIDIFMESLLGALVRFGTVVTIEPGFGAVAFCAVVILTMIAAEMFDPRLMWDAAARRPAPADVAVLQASPGLGAG
jgi:paraquat-inducible protein A